jgi:hypothetical protein
MRQRPGPKECRQETQTIDDIVGGIVSELEGLPAAATRDLVMRRLLEQLVRDIRQRAADRLAAQVEHLQRNGRAIDHDSPHS